MGKNAHPPPGAVALQSAKGDSPMRFAVPTALVALLVTLAGFAADFGSFWP